MFFCLFLKDYLAEAFRSLPGTVSRIIELRDALTATAGVGIIHLCVEAYDQAFLRFYHPYTGWFMTGIAQISRLSSRIVIDFSLFIY